MSTRELPGPYEMFDIGDGETRCFHVVRYEIGTVTIHPRYPGAPALKQVEAIRVYVKPGEKEYLPNYWDITQRHLVAALKPLLPEIVSKGLKVCITAVITRPGIQASKRFKIQTIPE